MRKLLLTILLLAGCAPSQAQSDSEKNKTTSKAHSAYTAVSQLPRNSSSALKPLYQPYSDKTPVFRNQALIKQLSAHPGERIDHLDSGSGFGSLDKRQSSSLPTGTCAPGVPCSNGACCSNTGVCSYAPSSCAPDVCISKCDAKAPCGEHADPNNATCPLNVCCSQYGFCKPAPLHELARASFSHSLGLHTLTVS